MQRRSEALISQLIISKCKTIYVEGNLDSKMLRSFLETKNYQNIRVAEINIEINESHLPIEEREISKNKIINIIKKCNEENIAKDYLGIIDLDYDYFNKNVLDIKNLLYTDFNSMESYFLDVSLFNKLLSDFDIKPLNFETMKKWELNSLLYSAFFYFQLCEIANLDNKEKISFKEISLDSDFYIDYSKSKINLKNIIEKKTQCDSKTELKEKYFNFIKTLNRTEIYSNLQLFLHGKYTFKFFVSLIKAIDRKIKNLSYDVIEVLFKDKFIMFYADNTELFKKVSIFAER